MTYPTYPARVEPVENFRPVGPVTVVRQPCGHRIDERVYDNLLEE